MSQPKHLPEKSKIFLSRIKQASNPRSSSELDLLLALFPHRFDTIRSEAPEPENKPQWERLKYRLSDREMIAGWGIYLYGVSFDKTTQYLMFDIDIGSLYHPNRDRMAIPRIRATLETLGLVNSLVCTSSYSGGLHIYFPLPKPQHSWQIAQAVEWVLTRAGFKIAPGHLEIFPNPRRWSGKVPSSVYAAHRLPLQAGSYLIDQDIDGKWLQVGWDFKQFVDRWRFAKSRNSVSTNELKQLLHLRDKLQGGQFRGRRFKDAQQDNPDEQWDDRVPVDPTIIAAIQAQYGISPKGAAFLGSLNQQIEPGWSGHGESNFLFGRIALRGYIFAHITSGLSSYLTGEALVRYIVETAQALPGYKKFCRHKGRIWQRAKDWAKCVEASHYYPFGSKKGKPAISSEEIAIDGNTIRKERTRNRIKAAVQEIVGQLGKLPGTITALCKLLAEQFHIGRETLYQPHYLALWHPKYRTADSSSEPAPPGIEKSSSACASAGAAEPNINLLEENFRNFPEPFLDNNSDSEEKIDDSYQASEPETFRNAETEDTSLRGIEPGEYRDPNIAPGQIQGPDGIRALFERLGLSKTRRFGIP